MFKNDRPITISTAGSRKATQWPARTLLWSELVERLKSPVRGRESLAAYLALPKQQQDHLKDVGGFVGGTLAGNRRKADQVTGRDVVALDLDNIPAGQTPELLQRVEALGWAYCVYSTRKHAPARPRLRILLPTDRTATADEYEPLARRLAQLIGMELCDPSTFEASRLMYWPSCCADGEYIFQYGDKPFLAVDRLLARYQDWRQVAEWPEVPGAPQTRVKQAARQSDPAGKPGPVGDFCRTYDVHRAIEVFIPEAYTPEAASDRYTYTGGSTTGGAVVYDQGRFIYSHHATDPAGGRLCNAFDLVRLHLFSRQDDGAKPDTPVNRLPSYAAMCRLAAADPAAAAQKDQARYQRAVADFQAPAADADDAGWLANLKRSPTTGKPLKNTANVRAVLAGDPLLKGRIRKDTFADYIVGTAPLPWRQQESGDFKWTDDDDSNLRQYIEELLEFRNSNIVQDALRNHALANSFNPVSEYLLGLAWDGVPRLDKLYVDYLGAEDCPYVRAVTRKGLVAAVARIMDPGCKFDTMTVLSGRQGIGKSTLLAILGGRWFSDSLRTFEGKEAAELLQGLWILEIAELAAYGKSDIRTIKQFLSKTVDHYRAAYGRNTEEHKRKCVFFGTTNEPDYLNDPTGSRRFWPVEAEAQKPTKSVMQDLAGERNQIWAEAVRCWQQGEPLILTPGLEAEAERRRSAHSDRDTLQGPIEEFLAKPVPEDWDKWALSRRQLFWAGCEAGLGVGLILRQKVCAMEIWKECLNDYRQMKHSDANRIKKILRAIPGWEEINVTDFGPGYGRQRGFQRRCNKQA